MSDAPETEIDFLAELSELVGSFRAYLEWNSELGTTGLPRDPEAKERVQRLAQELNQQANARDDSPNWDAASSLTAGSPLAGSSSLPAGASSAAGPSLAAGSSSAAGRATGNPLPASAQPSPANARTSAGTPPSDPTPERQPEPTPTLLRATPLHVLPPEVASLGSAQLVQAIENCTKCALHQPNQAPLILRGGSASGICFVGDFPGEEDVAHGQPFRGEAGALLDKMLGAMGLTDADASVMLLTKCYPADGHKPTQDEIESCSPYLHRHLELLRPKMIVALGTHAANTLLGTNMPISKLRGKFRLYRGKVALMPTFHPSYLLHMPSAKRQVWSDLKQVLSHLGREIP